MNVCQRTVLIQIKPHTRAACLCAACFDEGKKRSGPGVPAAIAQPARPHRPNMPACAVGGFRVGLPGVTHAASRVAGSGSMSSSVTAPSVNSRTAFMFAVGTPLTRHCETAEGVTPKCAASAAARPVSALSQSENVMPLC